ncbi:cysteine-rich RLK (RECEPTOR-like protein kinase) 8 [Hibiscus trionum]|uniref:Cysteine-rich RLK (RECEPTOR-like protein kinase) 8 n=1 Tax=Hibiscus trionum TaxID=183268 RepID=A0A9W7IQ91_HIBTR|nr:cysteine-rich RLK (RECEPTOR-like protein kinase) 8 [Hibiscus trionum]
MDPETKKIIISRDVVFDEVSRHKDNGDKGTTSLPLFLDDVPSIEGCTQFEENIDVTTSTEDAIRKNPPRQRKPPSHLSDYVVEMNYFSVLSCFFMEDSCGSEPKLYNEAKGVPEWEDAMVEEISALNKNDTWELVPKPVDVDLITCKWVYKLKKKTDGTIDRYKARLVARGFSQQYGRDYDETFSPVARMTTVRTIISLAASRGWNLWQLDVKNAFLYGELDRDIFMEQPQGFISKEYPNHVCRLKKALYGLKQAPRAWFGKIAQYLDFCGFKSSSTDPSLFTKKTSTACTLLLLYVDDMIITGDDSAEISSLQDALMVRFEMKSLGEASCFLGLEIEKCDGYFVSQKGYAANLLQRFRMEDSKAKSTPMEFSLKLAKNEGKILEDATIFRQLVGSLFYLTITRPDIAFSVGVISQFMEQPCEGHLIAAKRILRYIKGTLSYGLMYEQAKTFSLSGFVDADWAGDVNDRRSTTGFCFTTGSAAISWCSKKQTTVALSSCEAEYVAATMATQECLWLRRLIQEIVTIFKHPIPIYCDNESAIKLAGNPVFHARSKHIETHYHFVREKVLSQDIELQKIRTDEQVADIFTKALAKAKFEGFRGNLGVSDRKLALREAVKR